MDRINIASGPLALQLVPDVGGAIARFDWTHEQDTTPILRPGESDHPRVLDMGCFPLIPYCNRIRGGRFSFRGREVNLTPNLAGDPSPLHGRGWLSAWTVDRADDASAELSFRHWAGEWPWDYEGRQRIALGDDGLEASLSCRNLSDRPMPCGLGFHPYFLCGPDTRIDTGVTCAWTIDEHVLPVDKVQATGRFDLSNRLVCGQGLDNGFGGWGGRAGLSDPGWPFELAMASSTARFFQLYSPPQGGIFVAEPVTHANAALNAPEEDWPELGMAVLEPGEEMSLDMRIEVTPRQG
jgi:aldose 1-epimerase